MQKEKKITAHIDPDRKDALWLVVEHEDSFENSAHPILVSEVEAIRNACEDYLKTYDYSKTS